mgnify:CR=1
SKLISVTSLERFSFAVIYIGRLGFLSILVFLFLCFLVVELEWTPEKMVKWLKSLQKNVTNESNENLSNEVTEINFDGDSIKDKDLE